MFPTLSEFIEHFTLAEAGSRAGNELLNVSQGSAQIIPRNKGIKNELLRVLLSFDFMRQFKKKDYTRTRKKVVVITFTNITILAIGRFVHEI